MRMSCPNYDRKDGLETVLEVPIPEEMFASATKNSLKSWRGMKSWIRSHVDKTGAAAVTTTRSSEPQILLEIVGLLEVVGAPLIPLQVPSCLAINHDIKHNPIASSAAKYIVQQYIAAAGGDKALNGVNSMYAMGKVKMMACGDIYQNDGKAKGLQRRGQQQGGVGAGEVGAFVLWQKRPDLWSLEIVLSGCKIATGSDGKVAWRQTPWLHSSRGPPRPLRRSLQGLDPRSTASLFSKSECVGEKLVNGEACFVLKLQAEPSSLKARSSKTMEIIRHTMLGYFSQRTGLLVKLDDSNLVRINDNIYWETTMESLIQDYRKIDGIMIAHGGRTAVSLFKFGEGADSKHSRTRMEEVWTIEEVDFNIKGLTMDCFLPPSDMMKEQDECSTATSNMSLPVRTRPSSGKMGSSKVAAVDIEESDLSDNEDGDET